MPELPEVETTLRGISPHVTGQTILELVLRTPKLRWPLDDSLCRLLPGQKILKAERRAKYLLLYCERGTLILHLGMSGVLRIIPAGTTEQKHDHIDLIFTNGQALRFTDPRKFGVFTYTDEAPDLHKCLASLGPEPLSNDFTGADLYRRSRGKKQAIKPFIMDQNTVVGVGNIYASEALYRAGIYPMRQAGRVGLKRYEKLVEDIKDILQQAIAAGGTTISDFRQTDGRPGYFDQQLQVYGRPGQPCLHCGSAINCCRLGQRSTFYCPQCQR
jgi:formamidopyrimidine-DNA glycosylase